MAQSDELSRHERTRRSAWPEAGAAHPAARSAGAARLCARLAAPGSDTAAPLGVRRSVVELCCRRRRHLARAQCAQSAEDASLSSTPAAARARNLRTVAVLAGLF